MKSFFCFRKKTLPIFIQHISYFFHQTIAQTLHDTYLKNIKLREKRFQCILALIFCSSSSYSFIKHQCATLNLNDVPYLTKPCERKVTARSNEHFTYFCFAAFWNLIFMCKGSQTRNYADLLRFQSRAKDPIHILILTKSIISFLIYSFHNFTLVYEQEK